MGLFGNRIKILPKERPTYFESNTKYVVFDEGNRLSVYDGIGGYNGYYPRGDAKLEGYIKITIDSWNYYYIALYTKYPLLADLRKRLGEYDEQSLYYVSLDDMTTKQENDVLFFGTYAETVELMKREAPEAVFSDVRDGDRVDFNGDRYCGTIVQLKSNRYIFDAFKNNYKFIPKLDNKQRYELDTKMLYLNDK